MFWKCDHIFCLDIKAYNIDLFLAYENLKKYLKILMVNLKVKFLNQFNIIG